MLHERQEKKFTGKEERMLHKGEKNSQARFEECHTRDILIIFNTCVALPHILFETIITCKNHHKQEGKMHQTMSS